MRTAAVWTSIATVAALNIVVGLGLSGFGDRAVFGLALAVLHVVLPVSSCLMLALFVRSRRWGAAGLAAALVAGMLTMGVLDVGGVSLSLGFHLATDVAALNAYWFAVPLLCRSEPRRTE